MGVEGQVVGGVEAATKVASRKIEKSEMSLSVSMGVSDEHGLLSSFGMQRRYAESDITFAMSEL